MYCRNCGNEMHDEAVVCVKCGVPAGKGTSYCPHCGAEAPRMLSNTSFILKGGGWFASSYGHGTSNAFDKTNGVPSHGSKPAEEGSSSTPKAESAPAASGDSAKA